MPTSSALSCTVAAVLGFALALLTDRAARAQLPPATSDVAHAQEARDAAGSSAETETHQSSLVRFRMPSGLRVVLDADRSESSVVVCLALGVGTKHEPEGKDGLAWLLSRRDELEPRGSSTAKAAARLRAAGGTSSAEVRVDETLVCTRAPSAQLALALQLAAARMAPLRTSAAALATLKASALRELERDRALSLEELGERRLRQLVFQGLWPYAHAGLGSPAGISAVEHADLEQLQARFVAPANAALSISGLFSEREARRFIQEQLGRLSGRSAEPIREEAMLRQTSERFNASVDLRASTPLAFYAWPVPIVPEAELSALRLLAQVLTDSARLRAAPAAGTPDIDDVRAWLLPQQGPTALAVRVRVNARSTVDKAKAALERELERLGGSGPTEAELDSARARIQAELEAELDSASTRAAALAQSALRSGDAARALREPAAYDGVRAIQIRQAARAYISENRRTSVELYPRGWPQDLPPEVVRREHIVKAGENLIQIASRYHSSVEAIAAANRIKTHRFIFPGQELIIPVKTADLERAKKRSYTVKPGDTLMGIAARFGVSTRALAQANRRKRDQPIRIGETLTLPDAPRAALDAQKAKAKLRQHRVKRGDSLLGLARRYGVSAAEIAAANGRKPNQPILAGELLAIPSPARAAQSASPKAPANRASPKAAPKAGAKGKKQ